MKRDRVAIDYRTPPRTWRGPHPKSVLVVVGIILAPVLLVLLAIALLRVLW